MTSLTHRSNFYKYPTQLQSVREVIATLSDKRRSVCNEELGIAFFEAAVLTQTDYYPFGAVMPDRRWSAGAEGYRYGFDGMERDDEVKGSGNSYNTEIRQMDARLGVWLTVDPEQKSFPWQSSYCAYNNNPIYFTDPHGNSTIEDKLNNVDISSKKYESFENNEESKYDLIDFMRGSNLSSVVTPKVEIPAIGNIASFNNMIAENFDDIKDKPESPGKGELKFKYKVKWLLTPKYWFNRKGFEENILCCLPIGEVAFKPNYRRLELEKPRKNRSFLLAFAINDLVVLDINYGYKRIMDNAHTHYFPGRLKRNGKRSTAYIQFFYWRDSVVNEKPEEED